MANYDHAAFTYPSISKALTEDVMLNDFTLPAITPAVAAAMWGTLQNAFTSYSSSGGGGGGEVSYPIGG